MKVRAKGVIVTIKLSLSLSLSVTLTQIDSGVKSTQDFTFRTILGVGWKSSLEWISHNSTIELVFAVQVLAKLQQKYRFSEPNRDDIRIVIEGRTIQNDFSMVLEEKLSKCIFASQLRGFRCNLFKGFGIGWCNCRSIRKSVETYEVDLYWSQTDLTLSSQ